MHLWFQICLMFHDVFFWGGCDPSRDFRLAGGSIMLFQLSSVVPLTISRWEVLGFFGVLPLLGRTATVAMFRHRDNYDKLDKTAAY